MGIDSGVVNVDGLVQEDGGNLETLINKDFATEATLAKIPGLSIPIHDYLAITYVPSGDGVGEIQTVTFKTGGAGGTTVATLTLAYDANDKLSSVTKS